MINFVILKGENKQTCQATDVNHAAQILTLLFPQSKAYVVENKKVVFAHNLTVQEAEVLAGIRSKPMQSIEVLPKKKAKKKPVAKKKPTAKKTKLKSKVAVKKTSTKKTKIKPKAKPKPKPKVKAKPKAKAKPKPVKAKAKINPKGKPQARRK